MDVYILEYPLLTSPDQSEYTTTETNIKLIVSEHSNQQTAELEAGLCSDNQEENLATIPSKSEKAKFDWNDVTSEIHYIRSINHEALKKERVEDQSNDDSDKSDSLCSSTNSSPRDHDNSSKSQNGDENDKGDGSFAGPACQPDCTNISPEYLQKEIDVLHVKIEKQQQNYKRHEKLIKSLYEEELDTVEEDYSNYMAQYFHDLQKARSFVRDQIECQSNDKPVALKSKSIQTSGMDNKKLQRNKGSQCHLMKKSSAISDCSNPQRCSHHNDSVHEFDIEREEKVLANLSQKTQKLLDEINQLTKQVESFSICGKETVTKESDYGGKMSKMQRQPPGKQPGVGAKGKRSRRYKKRQKACEPLKSPRKEHYPPAHSKISNNLLLDSIHESATKDNITQLRTNLDEEEEGQGWQTVKHRRSRRRVHRTDSKVHVINIRPQNIRKTTRVTTNNIDYGSHKCVGYKLDPLSYSGRLQLGQTLRDSQGMANK